MLRNTFALLVSVLLLGFVRNTTQVVPSFHKLHLNQLAHPTAFTFLSKYVKDKKIVGLGEVSHGTQEFYQAKCSIAKYLIDHHQFRIIAFEMDTQVASQLNEYVHEKHNQLDEILKSYGLYNAKELKKLLVWIRHKNTRITTDNDKIHLVGFDHASYWTDSFRRDSLMAQQLISAVSDQKCIVWAHVVHLFKSNTWDTTHSGVKAMGNYIAQRFGNQYYLIALDTQQGEVNVVENGELKAYPFALDKNILSEKSPDFYWDLKDSIYSQNYELTYLSSNWTGAAQKVPTRLGIDLDGLLFIQNTTASQPID